MRLPPTSVMRRVTVSPTFHFFMGLLPRPEVLFHVYNPRMNILACCTGSCMPRLQSAYAKNWPVDLFDASVRCAQLGILQAAGQRLVLLPVPLLIARGVNALWQRC